MIKHKIICLDCDSGEAVSSITTECSAEEAAEYGQGLVESYIAEMADEGESVTARFDVERVY